MTFEEILDQAIAILQRRGRLTYRTLKRHFQLDDAALDDLKNELIEGQRLAVDERGNVLVWTGDTASVADPAAASALVQAQAPLAYTPPYLAEKILTTRRAMEGERKQVTVLFGDLKGNTELIRDLDPEAGQTLLDTALQRMMDAVHRFEGTVNDVAGDGIMAMFGAPIAHEDHALRACYAALAMQAALRRYADEVRRTHGLEVLLRVGLNSGGVLVRTIGNDLYMNYSGVGLTTNLASRMEQLAPPGTIRLTAATLQLVEGAVRVNALGPIPVKGLAEPVEVFELVGATPVHRRLQAAVARGLTRFVGRDQELAALTQALAQAGRSQGQLMALLGEAGVGKSRLVYECVHSHTTQGWRVLESASVSYGRATPYFPVIDLLKRYAHVEDTDDARTIRAKVTGQVLTLDETLQGTLPALLALLDVLPDASPFRQLDPAQRRQRTLAALKRVLLRESQVQPLLLVFEDLHWIDSETQALLDSLVESLPTARILLLVNYRPEYQHGWGSKTFYTQVRLDPLPPARADELLQALMGTDTSLAALTPFLIARTAGNPFFLEESVQTLVETQVLVGERGGYRLAQPLASLQVPATVQAVLAARIDRLPPEEKRLLQTAAVIGNEVPFPLLQAIAEVPDVVLHGALSHLQAAEFLYETRLFPDHEYIFKHVLTHEVAYGNLLQERRRVLHARIVEALEARARDRVAEVASGRSPDQVERLASHALRGEVWDKALTYCRQAGDKALTGSAYRTAVGYFEQALEALTHLPPDRPTLALAIDLRLRLCGVLMPFAHWEQILTRMREAETIAAQLGDQHRMGRVCRRIANTLRQMQDHEPALAYCQRTHAIAMALGDVEMQVAVYEDMGQVYYDLGQYRQAMEQFQPILTAFQRIPSDGVAYGQEARQMAEAGGRPYDRLAVYVRLGRLQVHQGTLHQAIPLLEQAVALSQEADMVNFYRLATAPLALAYALAGRATDALAILGQMSGKTPYLNVSLTWGEVYLRVGGMEEAHRLTQEVLTDARRLKARGWEAWALWLLGEIALHCDPPDVVQAEAHYQQALALADELGMRPLQAHCHRGLGTLYAATGQREQARAALAAAIALYRAMDMAFWLPQTEAALAQVEGQ